MRLRFLSYITFVATMLMLAACNVTRSLPEGEYLLSKVSFRDDKSTPRDERITVDRDDLESYVRQSPNKRILGIDFYVWVYEKANPNKDNWINNTMRKIGEEPVPVSSAARCMSFVNVSWRICLPWSR